MAPPWPRPPSTSTPTSGGPPCRSAIRSEGEIVARVPIEALSEAPKYDKERTRPAWLDGALAFDPLTLAEPDDYDEALTTLLGAPTIACKEWAFRQYDQQVGINTL